MKSTSETHTLFYWVAFLALAFGVLYRLFPLLGSEERLVSFFTTEDGYLMLTVARNMAIGNGMSVSDGAIATNGIQPLATFLFTLPYLFTGGDKVAGIAGVTLISVAVSVLSAYVVFRFIRRAFGLVSEDPGWAWLATALWFIGPLLLGHTMNALETGLYTLCVVTTVLYFWHLCDHGRAYTLREQIILGCLCGFTFLARIDGALFVTTLFLVRFIYMQASGKLSFIGAVKEALLPGIISLLWAAPWLTFNYQLFGSIMPISGTAQSHAADFARNLSLAPAKMFETMFPMVPIPGGLETNAVVILVCMATLLGVAGIVIALLFRKGGSAVPALLCYLVFAVAFFLYYGLFFGAGWFLSRYFAPLAPGLIAFSGIGFLWLMRTIFGKNGRIIMQLGFTGALVLSAALLARLVPDGAKDQGHFQVVNWVSENVPSETWVGAVQSGTVGYWHDRTINLDGKVNPAALSALLEDGHPLNYAATSEIEYVADWEGMAFWPRDYPEFGEIFEVLVHDPELNLAILKRKAD